MNTTTVGAEKKEEIIVRAVKNALRLRLNSEQPGCHIRTETVPAKSKDCFHVSHSDFFECGWAGSVLVQWS